MDHSGRPVIVEAAISPLRRDAPAQSIEVIVDEALACVSAGAGIVHYHHDMRLAEQDGIQALSECAERIHRVYPGTLTYTDYLSGTTALEENAHLKPMAESGHLTMFAVDPGITSFPSVDRSGRPTRTYTDGLRFDECHEMVEFSKQANVPISLGVFEPGHLRWILAYENSGGFSSGTIIKLYFGGRWMVDRVDTPGINFGLPPTTAALDVYLSMMEGSKLPWIVSVFGDSVLDLPLARYALERGGHLRVGVEDAAGQSPLGNADMVASACDLAAQVGRPVATSTDALHVLRLPAGDP